ncbi:hypothetical protein PV682_11395 [Streptomyces niveiscabiei]|uniref:hypothetical protein n=1 Tax=Streptomyces niveiscabiei TaxID=164115 RepID=UPI0029AB69A4|nr:hypothetical protein [Streptomyces niveiscabiei]MDX3382056.1 hypothetical protein [Streptomyces niveiscabiei]
MNRLSTRRFTLTASAVTALAASLALAGSAVAVAPASATASYNCDAAGSGTIKLTAADSGGVKSVKLDSTDIVAQFPYAANSVTTTLKLKKASGAEVQFSGAVHPAATTGAPLSFGPLPLSSGSLAAGDVTDSAVLAGTPSASNWSLKFVVTNAGGTFTSYCTATSTQSSAFTW